MGSSFNDRKNDGKMGEDCVERALSLQIIPNSGYGLGPQVTETKWNDTKKAQIWDNKVNGDLWFIDTKDGRTKYIDAKNSAWVADESLKHFRREDSYYFINAFTWCSKSFYFLIKATDEMREWVRKNCERKDIERQNKIEIGYVIDYKKLDPNIFNSRNDMIPEMDPKRYRVECVTWKMTYNDENGIPYVKRIQ